MVKDQTSPLFSTEDRMLSHKRYSFSDAETYEHVRWGFFYLACNTQMGEMHRRRHGFACNLR